MSDKPNAGELLDELDSILAASVENHQKIEALIEQLKATLDEATVAVLGAKRALDQAVHA